MGNSPAEEEKIGFLEQNIDEFVKDEEPEIQIPKAMVEEPEIQPKAAYKEDFSWGKGLTIGEYLTERYKRPPFDYTKAPKPFPIKRFPIKVYTSSSDSDSDSESYSDSDSDSDSEAIAEEESGIQTEKFPKDMALEPEIQPSAAPEQDKTPAETIDERLDLDFDSEIKANKPVPVELAKSSSTELISKPIVPASSVLVKHGTKRPAEGGHKDFKRAKEMASQTGGAGKETTDDENEGGGSLMSV